MVRFNGIKVFFQKRDKKKKKTIETNYMICMMVLSIKRAPSSAQHTKFYNDITITTDKNT